MLPGVYSTTFSLIEGLALAGLFQSVMILVYMGMRLRNWRQASVALAYFLCLALAFVLQFALRLSEMEIYIRLGLWTAWTFLSPLCYLLVLQVAQAPRGPSRRQVAVLLLVPGAFLLTWALSAYGGACGTAGTFCDRFFEILYWQGGIAGALSLLLIWLEQGLFDILRRSAAGRKERYWLVLLLIMVNVLAVGIHLLRSGDRLSMTEADSLLLVLGMSFVYLASTALFRVYPLPVALDESRLERRALTPPEREIAKRILHLLEVDKVYQEATLSRAALARELNISENTLSRVLNASFGKSFPKLMGEYRVEDAKRLLLDRDIPVQVVARESGFNSLASFNRVFRETVGMSPSDWRQGR